MGFPVPAQEGEPGRRESNPRPRPDASGFGEVSELAWRTFSWAPFRSRIELLYEAFQRSSRGAER